MSVYAQVPAKGAKGSVSAFFQRPKIEFLDLVSDTGLAGEVRAGRKGRLAATPRGGGLR